MYLLVGDVFVFRPKTIAPSALCGHARAPLQLRRGQQAGGMSARGGRALVLKQSWNQRGVKGTCLHQHMGVAFRKQYAPQGFREARRSEDGGFHTGRMPLDLRDEFHQRHPHRLSARSSEASPLGLMRMQAQMRAISSPSM